MVTGGVLTPSVGGIVIANLNIPKEWQWSEKQVHSANFLTVKQDPKFRDTEGSVVDDDQKPTELYSEIISAASQPQEWILDLCCGTGMWCMFTYSCTVTMTHKISSTVHIQRYILTSFSKL